MKPHKLSKIQKMGPHKLSKIQRGRKQFKMAISPQDIYPDEEQQPSSSSPPTRSPMSSTMFVAIIVIFGVLLDVAAACDEVLFISAEGRVCEKDTNTCQDIKMHSFQIGGLKKFALEIQTTMNSS